MLQRLYKTIHNKMANSWNVPCLGGDFTADQLRSMDFGIWEYITREMLSQNAEFLIKFHDKVHWNLIQREADTTGLSSDTLRQLSDYLDLKTVNYTHLNREFIQTYSNRLDSERIRTKFPELYVEIYKVPETIIPSVSSVIVPVVRAVGVKGQAAKSQATEEERTLSKEKHGIKDIVPHEKEENVALNEGELEMRGYTKVTTTKTTHSLNIDQSSRYAKYADILPNSIPAKTERNMSLLEGISSELNLSRAWPLDGLWIPENKIGQRIIFMIGMYEVPIDVVRANAAVCASQGSFISRSKHLTEDIIMFLGNWLDWTQVNPVFYTPNIIRKFIGQVNLKHVVMRNDADMYQNLPEVIAYKSRADAIIIEYLEQKVELQEKMTRERFVQTRSAVPVSMTRKGLEQSFDDDYRQQMFDDNDNDSDEDDSLTLLRRRAHAQTLQNPQAPQSNQAQH